MEETSIFSPTIGFYEEVGGFFLRIYMPTSLVRKKLRKRAYTAARSCSITSHFACFFFSYCEMHCVIEREANGSKPSTDKDIHHKAYRNFVEVLDLGVQVALLLPATVHEVRES